MDTKKNRLIYAILETLKELENKNKIYLEMLNARGSIKYVEPDMFLFRLEKRFLDFQTIDNLVKELEQLAELI